jgi:hypothetical protein
VGLGRAVPGEALGFSLAVARKIALLPIIGGGREVADERLSPLAPDSHA